MGELGDLAWAEDHLRAGLRTLPHGGAALALVRGESAAVVVLGQAAPGRPVEAATPFHICSCAKMFTAAVAARLAADGAFDWDAPIRGVLPAFMLADETVTAQCSFRDLAAMRVGLTRDGVAEWGFRQDAPTAERLARARHMALVAPFRDRVSYSNLCYIALAMAAAQKAGRPFAALFDEIIARPLGLKDSWSEGFGAPPRTAPAQPHMPLGGVARPVRELTGPNSEGSARIYLSARDATRWMGFLLAAFAGSEIGPLGAADVAMMMSPQAVERAPDRRLAPLGGNYVAYFLGLSIT